MTALPVALARWSGTLSLLEPALATALGPLVRRIDELVSRGDVADAPAGEPDGFGGIARRGSPERLLVSQWALAEVEPLEFLRRAATTELLHLEPNRAEARPRGAIAVLADCGPDQVGAARLVQLATLIVLHGRADRLGAGLHLGVLGDRPGTWQRGRIGAQLDYWLRSRRAVVPAADEMGSIVAAWDEEWTDQSTLDETWVLTGPHAAAGLPGRRRLVVSAETGWQATGATAVDVRVDGHHAILAMPPTDASVRALRGASLVRHPTTRPKAAPGGHGPFTFTGNNTSLLARTADGTGLVRLRVTPEPKRPVVTALAGRVITAALLGRRVVALVDRGDTVQVAVVGKSLADLDSWSVPAGVLPTERDDSDSEGDGIFAPLVFDAGRLLTRLGGQWWSIRRDRATVDEHVVGVAATDLTDRPLVGRLIDDEITVHREVLPRSRRRSAGIAAGAVANTPRVVFGEGLCAWSYEPGRWQLPGPIDRSVLPGQPGRPGRPDVVLDEGERVLGVHRVDNAPALVVLSPGRAIVRLRWVVGERTLTGLSGSVTEPSVHPTRPWLAVRRDDGSLLVGDVRDGSTVMRAGPA